MMKLKFALIVFLLATNLFSQNLPPGINQNGSTGQMTGTPTTPGSYPFQVQVTDTNGHSATQNLSILVTSPITSGENAFCASGDVCSFGGTDGPAILPTAGIFTGLSGTPAPGSTVTLACGGNLQSALNALTAGQKLVIPAVCSGVQNVITGNFTMPVVASNSISQWNWIETDQTGAAGFPAEGTRATPCQINQASVAFYPSYSCSSPSILMPKIVCSSGGNQSCFTAAAGADFFRFIGIEMQSGAFNSDGNGVVDLTPGADHIIFDRVLLHGQALNGTRTGNSYSYVSFDLKNGIQLQNARHVAFVNGWMWDVACPQGTCTDSHGFGGGNGTSTSQAYKVWNSMISAAGENFFQGGSGSLTASIATPTDMEIRNNHFFKPLSYALCTGCSGQHVEEKNMFEIKNGQRILIEGNVFENNWMGWQTDQSGYPLVIGARNQNSSVFLTATSDGSGGLVATSGSFGTGNASPIAAACASPNHCKVTVGNTVTTAQTQADSTHITVSPSPAAGSGISINQCTPGLNANAIATDIVVRYNDFRNSTNGPEFASTKSDCNDQSLGLVRFTVHDNLMQGINSDLNNASSGNSLARCTFVFNGQTNTTITDYVIEHNTCAIGRSGNFGNSGLDVSQDSTTTTTDGSTGAYMANRTIQNNIGPAGGITTYAGGTLFPGGTAAGFKQQSCTPALTGTTCTYTYSHNVLGTGQWTSQTVNSPFPATNQTCNSSAASCFPNGSAFTNLFVSYNGPSGQPGYLGDYHLSASNPFTNAGTDGKDIGGDIPTILSKIAGVRTSTSYTAANITTTALTAATHNVAYSFKIAASSASDMQVWRVISGTLPTGISLSLAGVLSGTPTVIGTSTFTVKMMDAAQQYSTKTFSLTVN
jgi:hypothetical protein